MLTRPMEIYKLKLDLLYISYGQLKTVIDALLEPSTPEILIRSCNGDP
jgi:hypothetical protein